MDLIVDNPPHHIRITSSCLCQLNTALEEWTQLSLEDRREILARTMMYEEEKEEEDEALKKRVPLITSKKWQAEFHPTLKDTPGIHT